MLSRLIMVLRFSEKPKAITVPVSPITSIRSFNTKCTGSRYPVFLKTLFAEHYIEVPQDKYDVLGEMQDKIDSLETKLNESVEEKIALTTEKTSFQRQAIVTEACADLTLTESDKFAKLVEDIDFGSEAIFAEKIAVVKENYFPKQAVVSEEKLDDTVDGEYLAESSNSGMKKYAQAISKSVLK